MSAGHFHLMPCDLLDAEGHSRLLVGLDVAGARPPHECGVVEVHFAHNLAVGFGRACSYVRENLPLLKGLLHAVSVRCECADGSILVRPIPDDRDDLGFLHSALPELMDESTVRCSVQAGAA